MAVAQALIASVSSVVLSPCAPNHFTLTAPRKFVPSANANGTDVQGRLVGAEAVHSKMWQSTGVSIALFSTTVSASVTAVDLMTPSTVMSPKVTFLQRNVPCGKNKVLFAAVA